MGNELARNFFQQRQGESFSTATPTHDCLRLCSSLLLHTAPYFSPTPSSSGASLLCRQHSLHSSTIVPAAVPLLHRAALCICHPWPFRPSASGSPLRSQPRSSPAADRHTRPFPSSPFQHSCQAERWHTTLPLLHNEIGSHTCTMLTQCVAAEDRPGQAMDFLSADESTGSNLVHL